VAAAEHDHRIAGCCAVGAGTQAPPHSERINNRNPRAGFQQPLDKTLGRIGLARAGRADNRDPVVKRIGRKSRRQTIGADGSSGARPLSRTAIAAGVGLTVTANLCGVLELIGPMFMLHSMNMAETRNDLQTSPAKPYPARSSSRRSNPPPLPAR
jgi:hypothetical protein